MISKFDPASSCIKRDFQKPITIEKDKKKKKWNFLFQLKICRLWETDDRATVQWRYMYLLFSINICDQLRRIAQGDF